MGPEYNEFVRFGPNYSSRWGTRVKNLFIHTEQGNGTADSLAAYCRNPTTQVSYHYVVRDGEVRSVVDTDYACWAVLDANAYSINLCFAGSFAEWSRGRWLEREQDIAIAAWLLVRDCEKYGVAGDVIPPPYHRADGLSDHRYVTEQLGIGTHTDVGDGFPWDVFEEYVRQYAFGEEPNMIDQEAERAESWLGGRLTQGELPCKDSVGRYADFQNGSVYWHPETGAHAVPTSIYETWQRFQWEQGPLGYPIGDHTVLDEGVVQGFQGGAIYRKNGQEGHPVWGMIRAYWNRTGFEDGEFGWPVSDEQRKAEVFFQDFEHGRILWSDKGIGTHERGGEFDEITVVKDDA